MSEPLILPPRDFPEAPDEVQALLGALHRNRRTFAWKCFGLSAEEMRRTLGPSTMTLAGLVKHVALVEDVAPSALGCEECLKLGSPWVHLRLCRICGHVGCCDDSPNKHASAHFHATGHPVIEGYDPPEGWGWCYVDEVLFDLSKRKTPHNGPIPRYY